MQYIFVFLPFIKLEYNTRLTFVPKSMQWCTDFEIIRLKSLIVETRPGKYACHEKKRYLELVWETFFSS